jgi:hypothetical protein
MPEVDGSLLDALKGFALAPFVWMMIKRWESSDMSSAKIVIYPTPLMVRMIKIGLLCILLLLWLSAILDLIGW